MRPTDAELDDLALRLRMVADPTRFQILAVLRGGPITVNEIASATSQSQPNISKHLRLMRAAGLVVSERHGMSVYYWIDPRTAEALAGDIRTFLAPGR